VLLSLVDKTKDVFAPFPYLEGAVRVAGEDVVLEVNDRRHLAVCTAVDLVDLLVAPHVLQWEIQERSFFVQ
jgi:hypothetical protein